MIHGKKRKATDLSTENVFDRNAMEISNDSSYLSSFNSPKPMDVDASDDFWGPDTNFQNDKTTTTSTVNTISLSVNELNLHAFTFFSQYRPHVVAFDLLNLTKGNPRENWHLLVNHVLAHVQKDPHVVVMLVVKSTDLDTLNLVWNTPFLQQRCVVFNVVSCTSDGNTSTTTEQLLQFAEQKGLDLTDRDHDDFLTKRAKKSARHALKGQDDFFLLCLRHFFGVTVHSHDRYNDAHLLYTVFRGVTFSVEVVDTRSGDYFKYKAVLVP